MTKRLKFLVTGGTGFLGQRLVSLLRANSDVDVISRSKNSDIQGDLLKWNAGLNIEALSRKKYDAFLHLAGLYDLSAPRHEVLIQNVVGTSTALRVASLLKIPVFLNTSSIAAATNLNISLVSPYDLNFSKPFHDPYAESKALSEQQIKNCLNPLRMKINLRLGILVGDSATGQISRIDGPYHTAKVFSLLKPLFESWRWPLPVPGNNEVRLPIVPVDCAANAIAQIARWAISSSEVGYRSFNIVPNEGLPVEDLYLSALRHLKIKHPALVLVQHIPEFLATKISQMALGFPEEQLRYALSLPKFDPRDTIKILGSDWCPEFSQYEDVFWRGYENYLSNR